LSYWLIISLKIYLETGHLIENFVYDWYVTTNMLKLGNRLKCWQPISKAFSILFSCTTPNILRNAVCVYALILFPAIFWGRDCMHSWNVNDKYCIAITPVEQSLHAVDYAWWQKQYSLLICSYCVCLTFAWGYCRLLFKHFCFYV